MMWVEIETIVFWEKNQLSALIWSKNTTLTFGWYFVVLIWLNSMFFFVSSVKIKYDDSKRPKKGLQEKNHLWVLIRSKTTVLTYVFFNSVWLNLMYCYFLSIKIKVMKVKTKIFFHENNFNRDFIQSKMLLNSG